MGLLGTMVGQASQWRKSTYVPLRTQDEADSEPQSLHPPLTDDELYQDDTDHDTPNRSRTVRALGTATSILIAILQGLLPSYIYLYSKRSKERKLRGTSSLDGLRGLAAFFVTACHYFSFFTNVNTGYVPDKKETKSLWNLPIFKFFYSGSAMVFIFFVISGYVLSLKSVKHMRQRDWGALLETLASSTFRRGVRLFGPPVAIIVILAFLAQMGMWLPARSNASVIPMNMRYMIQPIPWSDKLLFLWRAMIDLTNCYRTSRGSWMEDMDGPLWTIPIEFKCSLILFLIILGSAKVKPGLARKGLMGAFLAHQVFYQQWDTALFLSGLLLAEFDTPHVIVKEEAPTKQTMKQHLLWFAAILTGMYFCSTPKLNLKWSWGHVWLTRVAAIVYNEPERFWPSIGAIILVAAATRSDIFKRLLTTRIVQYIGDVSYAIYLIHVPIHRSFSWWLVPDMYKLTKPTAVGKWAIISGVFVISTMIVFTLGDLVWRYIDVQCVKLARWLETKFFLSSD